MTNHCPYCDSLVAAVENENYCSHKNQVLHAVDSNAYYFAENQFASGDHISRFSIRAVYNGYQSYQVGGTEHIIDQEKFLVINEGERFEHEIDQTTEAEGIIVAFNPKFLQYYLYHINHNEQQLLDNPFEKTEASVYFYHNSYEKSERLDRGLKKLIHDIKEEQKDPLYFQQSFNVLLDELVGIEKEMQQRINGIKALKGKTREELYRRLSTAKDFINANLGAKLSLEKIAHVACLSPFHFLRSFSACYGVTPYQYILKERLKKARFMLECTKQDYNQIYALSGFENRRTFQRAYQKKYGISPFSNYKELRTA